MVIVDEWTNKTEKMETSLHHVVKTISLELFVIIIQLLLI